MALLPCAKEAIDSRLRGEIKKWKQLEIGLLRLINSADFAALDIEKQKAIVDPILSVDKALTRDMEAACRSYVAAQDAILESIG